MQTAVVREYPGFLALKESWEDLVRDSQFDAPFYSWMWHRIWWAHFGKDAELFVIVVQDSDGRAQAIAPLMKTRRSLRGLKVTELRFMANGLTPRSNVLFRNDSLGLDAVEAVFACLAACDREWDMVTLPNVPDSICYLPRLGISLRDSALDMIEATGRNSPYIEMREDFQTFLAMRLGREHRQGIRRKVRRLTERNGYRFMEFREPHETQEALAQAFRVSKASWKGAEGTDMAGTDSRRGFYTELTHHFSRFAQVTIWLSELDGKSIAMQYHLTWNKTSHLMVTDFDEEYRHMSPGSVLFFQVVQRLHEERFREFDMAGDAYDYKMTWATGVRRHLTLEFFNKHALSRSVFVMKRTILPRVRVAKSRAFSWFDKALGRTTLRSV